MCWVMPPASPPATLALRMASSSDVLPWSTWPMIVTTGARGSRSSGFSAGASLLVSSSSSRNAVDSIWKPNSVAISVAVSRSMSLLMFASIIPSAHSFLMISRPWTAIFLASSATAIVSAMRITRLCSAGVVICVCFSFLPAAATRFLGTPPGRPPPGPKPGPPELIPVRAGLAHHRRAAAQPPELLVAILDLEALHRCVAGRPRAGKLDERARRRRSGDHRLDDRPERGPRRLRRRRLPRPARRLCRHVPTLAGAAGAAGAAVTCGAGGARWRGRRCRGGGRSRRRGMRRRLLDRPRARGPSVAPTPRAQRRRARQAPARAAQAAPSAAVRRRRRRRLANRGSPGRALGAAADDGVVEPNLFQVLQPLAFDGAADAVHVHRLEMGHVVRDVDAHRADLVQQVLGLNVQVLRQLVDAQTRPCRCFGFRSALVSTSHHRHVLSLSTRGNSDPLQQFRRVANRHPPLEGAGEHIRPQPRVQAGRPRVQRGAASR